MPMVLPGALFLLCRPALSAAERQFFVFPAFVYFASTLASQFASVTEGLVSTAYVWLLLYLILFGRLSAWRLSLILLLSIGCLRLHEEKSFLGPLLIAAGWMRWRHGTPSQPARLALFLALLAILASAVVGSYWILFPYAPEERARAGISAVTAAPRCQRSASQASAPRQPYCRQKRFRTTSNSPTSTTISVSWLSRCICVRSTANLLAVSCP